jgi:4-hydroxy-tetrahydrodipicolinate synthase
MMLGTLPYPIADVVEMNGGAEDTKYLGVLMFPPFFYKDLGHHCWFADYISITERAGDSVLQARIENIPPALTFGILILLLARFMKANSQSAQGVTISKIDAGSENFLLKKYERGVLEVCQQSPI